MRMREEAEQAHARMVDQLGIFAERLASVDPSGAAANMDALGTRAEANFRAKLAEKKGRLTDARRDLSDAENALADFKKEHGLKRPPYLKSPRYWHVALLATLMLIEVVPSAFVISEGDESGILGGFTSALFFTSLSMIVGFMTGFLTLPYANHKRPGLRYLVGWGASAVLMALVVTINLSLAHYRAIVAAGGTSLKAASGALPSLLADPFALGDIKSVLMAGFGMLFAFIALYEGRGWRDPYPGYARVAEFRRRAAQRFHDMVEDSLAVLKELEEDFMEDAKSERSSLRDRRQQVPRILEGRRRLVQRYGNFRSHVQETGNALLTIYRDANRKSRTSPPPAHFADKWILEGYEVPALDDGAYSFPDDAFEAADNSLREATKRLQEAYREGIAWIEKRAVEAGSAE